MEDAGHVGDEWVRRAQFVKDVRGGAEDVAWKY